MGMEATAVQPDSGRRGDWIQTYSGRQFWPLDPRPEDFCFIDIAHALAMKCRYNGHTRQFYSVAQHCVLVAEECERRWPDRPDLAWWGLLHDLEEAYLPDVPRPIKRMGTGILAESARLIMAAASVRFHLAGTEEPPEVKQVDGALLATEAEQLMERPPNGCDWYLPEPSIEMLIQPWDPLASKRRFLAAASWLYASRRIEVLQEELP